MAFSCLVEIQRHMVRWLPPWTSLAILTVILFVWWPLLFCVLSMLGQNGGRWPSVSTKKGGDNDMKTRERLLFILNTLILKKNGMTLSCSTLSKNFQIQKDTLDKIIGGVVNRWKFLSMVTR